MPEFPFLVICKPAEGSNPDSLKCTVLVAAAREFVRVMEGG